MEHNREERTEERRFIDRNKSQAGKKGWKRHHASMMHGVRERERNMENKTFYGVTNDLEEMLDEAKIIRDDVFDQEYDLSFEFISGGVSLKVNKETGEVSITTSLSETGSGAYKLEVADDASLKQIYDGLKEDITNICKRFDEEVQQSLAKYGLKSTK